MTLLDAQPSRPPLPIAQYLLAGVLLFLIAGVLYYRFHNYPEERAVARFLTTLQQGNYREAYRLWQPSPSYAYEDFLHDWGAQGDYGPIREFEILESRSKGSQTVLITVRINKVAPPLELAVDRKTKGLAYSIF